MNSAEAVALLAIMLREAGLNRHLGKWSLDDDMESCRGEISLALMWANQHFKRGDWGLAAMLFEHPENLLRTAYTLNEEGDELRCEALMHALPPGGMSLGLMHWRGKWTKPYLESCRWDEVAEAMVRLETTTGLAVKRDDVEAAAVSVYTAVTGRTHADYMDELEDTLFAESAWSAEAV